MATWFVVFIDRSSGATYGHLTLMNPEVEIRNSEPGSWSGEIALGQTHVNSGLPLRRDEFIPYESYYQVWRQSTGSGICISEGVLTQVNLNFNRDTILVSGKDWIHYLERRIYPFNPQEYKIWGSDTKPQYWRRWPKKWGINLPPATPLQDPVDISNIVRDLLLSMKTGVPIDQYASASERNSPPDPYCYPINWNIPDTGTLTTYTINPGESKSIYEHIKYFSEMKTGFEFDIRPVTREFKLWSPTKWQSKDIVYVFRPRANDEINGQITEFDWTNDGPNGTYLYGLGSGRHKIGQIWTTDINQKAAGRLDKVYDYGEIRNEALILQRLKDQDDLWNQKKLSLSILNPEFLIPSFYAAGRPRDLIGAHVKVLHDFDPYHNVNSIFKINAIKFSMDTSGNEVVNLELQMVYEYESGLKD